MLVLLFFFRKSHLNSFFIDEGKVAFCVLFENYSFEDGTIFFSSKGIHAWGKYGIQIHCSRNRNRKRRRDLKESHVMLLLSLSLSKQQNGFNSLIWRIKITRMIALGHSKLTQDSLHHINRFIYLSCSWPSSLNEFSRMRIEIFFI